VASRAAPHARRTVRIDFEWISARAKPPADVLEHSSIERLERMRPMVRERTLQLTASGKARLEEELAHLINVKRPELTSRIQDSSDQGDMTDNPEYDSVKEEIIQTDARIAELEQMLERAEVIEQTSKDSVGLGSTVTIRSDDGEEETYTLVDHAEADIRDGSISTESPVGQELYGKRPGDSATVKTPGGVIVYTVLRIE
jgi:transcription elongation factor GreA